MAKVRFIPILLTPNSIFMPLNFAVNRLEANKKRVSQDEVFAIVSTQDMSYARDPRSFPAGL
jgi:hypothetical protein